MNIGEMSRTVGLPAKTIRYYEDIGLVRPARGPNGYRDFSARDAHRLAFLGRARSLGFSIPECRTLLSLHEDRDRASAEVKAVAAEHLERIAQKIDTLQALKTTLERLVGRCHGDDRPDCPILDDLAGRADRTEGNIA